MANSSFTQQALAANASFQTRVRNALATVAWQVLNEPASTPNNTARVVYARGVINNLQGTAVQIAPWLVDRPNLFQFETSFDFPSGDVVTASGDADIESQLATDWDTLAGVSPVPPPLP
jgi:hypothetical protein